MLQRLSAEFIGTFMLVSAVCGAGAIALNPGDQLQMALAAGVSMMVMLFAVGHVSGGHFNPAITLGLAVAGRHKAADVIPYGIAQVLGAAVAAFAWYLIAETRSGPVDLGNFASNGFEAASPGHYPLAAAALAEGLAAALLVFVFAGVTDRRVPAGFAPIAIGFALFELVLIISPISNGSINPARSTGTALFGGTLAMNQLWLFWVAPIAGGALGGLMARQVLGRP